MAHIAIVGPGAVGCVIAASLAIGGHALTLCVRSAIRELSVDLETGDVRVPATILDDPRQASPADWVVVTTKAYDSAGAMAWFPGLVGPATRVAIVQNGVEHRERFATSVAEDGLLPVMVDCPAERPAPDRVVQRGPGRMVVPAGDDGQRFVDLFDGTPIAVAMTDDFRSAVWRKLCTNAAGAINALLLKPAGIFHDDVVGRLAVAMARECAMVGRAEGAILDDDVPQAVLEGYRRQPADSINSLHADRAAGRPMEVDARNGAVVRFGRKHGIPTPLNEMAMVLLSAGS